MLRVVVPEYLLDGHVARLAERYDVVYDADLYADRETLHAACATASAIVVRNRTQIDTALIAAAPTMKVVGRLGVGLDNIDMEACAAAGVQVFPAVGGNSISVAEYVIGAMLVLGRGVYGMTEAMVAGNWPRQGHAFGREFFGSTLGLVGFGAIGQHVAHRATAFGMRVVAHDPYLDPEDAAWAVAERMDFDELIATADVVSVHVPLVPATRHLIDAAAIGRMRPGAIVINTARGGVVDEDAVVAALRDGSLGGAALDVFESEPLRDAAAARFAGIDNLLLTPHVAGNTRESVARVATMTVDAVIEALDGNNVG